MSTPAGHHTIDHRAAELAAQAFGAFTRSDALAAGISPKAIRHRLEVGRWECLYPSVYAIAGVAPTWERSQAAACLWMKGLTARRAAARLFQLPGCGRSPVEVLTATRRVMPHSDVIVHRTNRLPEAQITRVKGIPCTSIERTLLDLSGCLPKRRAAMAVDDALRRQLTTLGALDHCLFLTAKRGRNGCAVLRELVHSRAGVKGTPESPLETVILEMINASSLPSPQLQQNIYGPDRRFIARPDFVYPEARLVIQGHSKQFHWGELAESKDLDQHNRLSRLGYRIVYVTWADATTHANRTVGLIYDLLKGSA